MNMKRPKRLWVICGLNIFSAGISLVALVFLLTSDKVPTELVPDITTIILAGVLSSFLIVTSILAFRRAPYSRWLTFIAAILFYGTLVLQQSAALYQLGDTLTEHERLKVLVRCTRSMIEIALNAWALFSAKTAHYFVFRAADPQPALQADGPASGGSAA